MLVTAEVQAIACAFHSFLKPVTDKAVVDVHELHADGAAIRIAQPIENLAERQRVAATHRLARKTPVQILFCKSIEFEIQLGWRRSRNSQRIKLGGHMASNTIVADELIHTFLKDGSCRFFDGCAVPADGRIEYAPGLECRCETLSF